ncbi:MAG: hypothetical protein JWM57_2826 [Phycisphaerales bacterium]|nr:hypothetical protein [Phycisphaerales bacterium]
MDDRELQGHLRLITMHRKFEETLRTITAAPMADRPLLFARLQSLKTQMTQLEVISAAQDCAGGPVAC